MISWGPDMRAVKDMIIHYIGVGSMHCNSRIRLHRWCHRMRSRGLPLISGLGEKREGAWFEKLALGLSNIVYTKGLRSTLPYPPTPCPPALGISYK